MLDATKTQRNTHNDILNIYLGGQDLGKTKMSSVEDWVKKMWHMDTMECCSAVREDEALSFVTTRMDLENAVLSGISQSERAKNHVTPLMCRI